MTNSERVEEWVRWYGAATLKMNALLAVQKNDPKLMGEVLKRLGLSTAQDVIEACEDDWPK